ncbi:hypothetical protein JTB14_006287 [Gonioctena quinquepunctata]|nr:hypothetical protein JTB14_006287 [Gonioctena quinquepunctata]
MAILEKVETGIKKNTIAQEYRIPQSKLCTIINNKSAFHQWSAKIGGPVLQQIVLSFAQKLDDNEFKASTGWFEKFRKRLKQGIWRIAKQAYGESTAFDKEKCDIWIKETFSSS